MSPSGASTRTPAPNPRIHCIRSGVRATSTAALAAGLAYGSLFLTRFEGFRQYGIIGFIGMLRCWASSIVVVPAVFVLAERLRPLVDRTTRTRPAWIFGPLSRFVGRFPKAVAASFAALTLLSVASFARFDPDRIIETNLANLRNRESMTRGSGSLCRYLDEVFQRFLTPVGILIHSPREAEKAAKILRLAKRDPRKAALLSSGSTIRQFVPEDQELIVIFFRKPKIVTLMLASLSLGTLWLFGFILPAAMLVLRRRAYRPESPASVRKGLVIPPGRGENSCR